MASVRIGKTRVLLELVIQAFQEGAIPREISQEYDTLTLADVYSVVAYYLPRRSGLKLRISDVENAQDLSLALEVADYFRVKGKRARVIVEEVVTVVKGRRSLPLPVPAAEKERMETAFRIADAA